MKFLHLLSVSASQTVSLHCYSDPDTIGSGQPGTARFQGWNGQAFQNGSSLQPYVLQDDCQVRDGRWQQSRFLLQAEDPAQLPIVNIQGLQPHQAGDQRHLEVGPVCFL
ncbi:collagen alpha-1(XXIV) chain [Astyanax mexicanus]|uniref:Collagen alpha-1(XXIV) chain n=2 Tax=Astyanax mexicanus TaxID=7994 RepID=A0A8B9KMW6_ASTMX|nr:collagen alpha-1(XXIV) chain [Astyanax mexicanus]